MEAWIIAEVTKTDDGNDNTETKAIQELIEVLEMEDPLIAEELREELAVLERLQKQEEGAVMLEIFDDSKTNTRQSGTSWYSADETYEELAEMWFPNTMIETVRRNINELKGKVKYNITNVEMANELAELEFDTEVINEIMGNIKDRMRKLKMKQA